MLIAGFIIGFAAGAYVAYWLADYIINEQRKSINFWHRRAMEYLELLDRASKRADDNGADWWKK